MNSNKVEIVQELQGKNTDEMAKIINSLGVFIVLVRYDIVVSTNLTLSKVNYKRCMKLNGGQYMKDINFRCEPTIENFSELLDISNKTKKFSQQALKDKKEKRLKNKFAGKSYSTSSSSGKGMSLDEYREFHEDVVGTPWEHNYVPKR